MVQNLWQATLFLAGKHVLVFIDCTHTTWHLYRSSSSSNVALLTSTKTLRPLGTGEPRAVTSAFTQLLKSYAYRSCYIGEIKKTGIASRHPGIAETALGNKVFIRVSVVCVLGTHRVYIPNKEERDVILAFKRVRFSTALVRFWTQETRNIYMLSTQICTYFDTDTLELKLGPAPLSGIVNNRQKKKVREKWHSSSSYSSSTNYHQIDHMREEWNNLEAKERQDNSPSVPLSGEHQSLSPLSGGHQSLNPTIGMTPVPLRTRHHILSPIIGKTPVHQLHYRQDTSPSVQLSARHQSLKRTVAKTPVPQSHYQQDTSPSVPL